MKRALLAMAGALVLAFGGCQGKSPELGDAAAMGPPIDPSKPVVYPPGRWRFAAVSELAKTKVWMSHILIRHRDVPAHLVSFSALGWSSLPDPPDRSREEALQLAERAAGFAARDVTQFSRIARELSEDITTREEGGSLGGVDASHWLRWPELLDAAAALAEGEVSRPVESAYGFHVFLRRPPPPEESRSGARIIIGHDAAPWLHAMLARRPIPPRSRAEASALAQSVYEQAASHPEAFERLVQAYSDHDDAVRSGDFGEWNTMQQAAFPRSVERLYQLDVGEVAPPMDGAFGFEIIRRTANRPRVIYGMERIQIDVKTRESEPAIVQYLQQVADELQRHPERFADYQRKHCCLGVKTWQEGQGSALHERVLATLGMGEISRVPTAYEGGGHAIVKRVPPGAWRPERVRLDLPAPARPSIERFVAQASAEELSAMGRAAVDDLGLGGEMADRLMYAHGGDGQFASAQSSRERWSYFEGLDSQLDQLLGASAHARYTSSIEKYIERELAWGKRGGWGRFAAPQVRF